MDEMLASMLTLYSIPVLMSLAFAIYKLYKRHMTKQELLEGAKKPDYQLSQMCRPQTYLFVEEKCVFFNRKPGPLCPDDVRILMRNAEKRITRKYIHPSEKDTTIEIACFDYNAISQLARIDFKLKTSYRTVIGYKQMNGVKYRIYSDPKIKERYYRETFHVTADALESLQHSVDAIVRLFREEVVIRLNSVNAVPSWAIRKWLQEEREGYEQYLNDLVEQKKQSLANATRALETRAPHLTKTIAKKTQRVDVLTAKLKTKSVKRAERQQRKIALLQETVSNVTAQLNELQKNAETSQSSLVTAEEKLHSTIAALAEDLPVLIKSITRLDAIDPAADGFVILARYMLKPYEKIIGVYVIRNNHNGRCYVGQSKDVVRRLKQHFRDGRPINPIFEHDYYMVSSAERETLFSVKVIPLGSKDELDRVERDLIEVYAAFANGYNGTKGNT